MVCVCVEGEVCELGVELMKARQQFVYIEEKWWMLTVMAITHLCDLLQLFISLSHVSVEFGGLEVAVAETVLPP